METQAPEKISYRDDKIRAAMAVQFLSAAELAERLEMSPITVRQIRDGKAVNPELTSLKKIAEALELSLAELFEEQEAA